ncbi:NAD(P)-binding protein [Backusella circina FSU 941]|nr:NAD(P)-binding protein [Backusella circina FSU 941]
MVVFLLIALVITSYIFLKVYSLFHHLVLFAQHLRRLHQYFSPSLAECLLEAVNLEITRAAYIPTLFRVYVIGVVETIYIATFKRGVFGPVNGSKQEKLVDDIVNQYAATNKDHARLALVTGGDTGIGAEITKGLLGAGFRVILASRTQEKDLNDLKNEFKSENITFLSLDLTSFDSVHQFVNQVKQLVPNKGISLLINNAGVMNVPFSFTNDGYESQCQTNYLSPILLTQLLLPYMQDNSRILFAASSTLYTTNNLDTKTPLTKYDLNGLDHYAYSKACISRMGPLIAKETNISTFVYHPGTVRTRLFSHTTVFTLPLLGFLFDYIMLTPKEGSLTPLYLCLTDATRLSTDEGMGGSVYWANQKPQLLPAIMINGKLDNMDELWKDTLTKCKIN